MVTDLFAVTSESARADLAKAVPPPCRRAPDPALALSREGDDIMLISPVWRPRRPAVHLLPSFAALGVGAHSLCFEVSVLTDGAGWSPWIGTVSLGGSRVVSPVLEPPGRDDALTADVDVFRCSRPASAVRLRLRLRGLRPEEIVGGRWLLTLSACDDASDPDHGRDVPERQLDVPPRSQHEEGGSIGHRLCSPTSVGMVLGYWGRAIDLQTLAAEVFVPSVDLYGVWPAAIYAAARHGVTGYLLRFPDWASAAWCLAQGLPVIASVRYRAGELSGAAVAETSGHLLVLTGLAGDVVLVNDPAATTAREVRRRYALDEIRRVWLERAGVGYVLFDPVALGS